MEGNNHNFTNDQLELRRIAGLWDEAMVTNDVNEIGKYISEEWEILGSDGITSRSNFLHVIKNGSLTHHTMNSDELKVSLYGDTGIVVSRGTSAGTWNGEAFNFYEWSTSIFIKKDGNWKCVLTMLAPAKNP